MRTAATQATGSSFSGALSAFAAHASRACIIDIDASNALRESSSLASCSEFHLNKAADSIRGSDVSRGIAGAAMNSTTEAGSCDIALVGLRPLRTVLRAGLTAVVVVAVVVVVVVVLSVPRAVNCLLPCFNDVDTDAGEVELFVFASLAASFAADICLFSSIRSSEARVGIAFDRIVRC